MRFQQAVQSQPKPKSCLPRMGTFCLASILKRFRRGKRSQTKRAMRIWPLAPCFERHLRKAVERTMLVEFSFSHSFRIWAIFTQLFRSVNYADFCDKSDESGFS